MINKIFKMFIAFFLLAFALVPVQATDYYNVNVGYQAGNAGVLGDFAYGGALAGTEGGAALDSLEIHLVDSPYESGIEYRVYTTSGWSKWFNTWETATNNSEAILGLQIQLKDFPNANVYYQSYRKGLGWGIWVSNGATSGQLNSVYPITGFRVQVDEIGVNYQSNVGGVTQVLRHNGETQGTGSLETVSMSLISADNGSIEYRAYLRNEGWTDWARNGTNLGSSGSVIEALEARLIDLPQYSVQIQPQVEGEWWGYVYDGQTAGSMGSRLTAYRVEIVQRVFVAPTAIPTVVVEEEPQVSDVVLNATPNVTGFGYDIRNSVDADDDFDDDPAYKNITIDDRFLGTAYLSAYVPANTISVPDTFNNYGDDMVDPDQFEVYSGTYDSSSTIFTVTGTRFQSPYENGTHTLILYDNDTTSSVAYLGSILVPGKYVEINWWVDGLTGSRVLRYSPVVFNNYGVASYGYPNSKMVADVTFDESDTFTGLTVTTVVDLATGISTASTYSTLSLDSKVNNEEFVVLQGTYIEGTFTVTSTSPTHTAIIYDYESSDNSYARNINGYVVEGILNGAYFNVNDALTSNAILQYTPPVS